MLCHDVCSKFGVAFQFYPPDEEMTKLRSFSRVWRGLDQAEKTSCRALDVASACLLG
jgi:hypothetical protein